MDETSRATFARGLTEIALRRRILVAAVGSSRPVSSGVTFWLSRETGLDPWRLGLFLSRPTVPHGIPLDRIEAAVEQVEQAFAADPAAFRSRLFRPPDF